MSLKIDSGMIKVPMAYKGTEATTDQMRTVLPDLERIMVFQPSILLSNFSLRKWKSLALLLESSSRAPKERSNSTRIQILGNQTSRLVVIKDLSQPKIILIMAS